MQSIQAQVLAECQAVFPGWRDRTVDDFTFADPKGFSSFTMAVQSKAGDVEPPAVLYRRLEGKENAILDFESEKAIYLALSASGVAARCLHYDARCRIEGFYRGRTLTAEEALETRSLEQMGEALHRLHTLDHPPLPEPSFFELLHRKWGPLVDAVLQEGRGQFPENEQAMCLDLVEITSAQTHRLVMSALPEGPLGFCHNDTYHGNVMKLDSGEIKLLDFEFSCLNHPAFDFANLFAETVMQHHQPAYPYFRIAEPAYTDAHIRTMVSAYLAAGDRETAEARERLVAETRSMIRLSDYMYAMAAIPLSVAPFQKTRFIPYAHQRFARFLASVA